MVDSERAGNGFLRFGLQGDAAGAISRSDTAKEGDVEYVPSEGSDGVDARPIAERVETSASDGVLTLSLPKAILLFPASCVPHDRG